MAETSLYTLEPENSIVLLSPCLLLILASMFVPARAFPQSAAPDRPLPVTPRQAWANIPQPPVPADPLELVTGNAQPVQDAEQRLAAVNLLRNSRSLSNVRAYPYDLKTTFVTFGSSGVDGNWQMEDSSPSHGAYRWTAQGPGYSVVNLYKNGLLYSDQPQQRIPLRLAQARSAIFFVDPVIGPRASVRTAKAEFNGGQLTCLLVERMAAPKSAAGGREWDESEYCVDSTSGVLMTYSPVPGLYVAYDYSSPVRFHDKIIPAKFVITEAGQTVVEAHTASVTDAATLDSSLFNPSGLTACGVGSLMRPASNVRMMDGLPANGPGVSVGIVVLHGMMSADGKLSEAEVLASSNPALNQIALDRASKWQGRQSEDAQPGATPESNEVLFTMRLIVTAGS